MTQFVLASGNLHKLYEFRGILVEHEVLPMPAGVALPPESVTTFRDNAMTKARALAAAGADAIVVETMTDLVEAKIALAAARATGLPVVVSVVFDSGKDKDRTLMGATPEQVVTELDAAGADVLGANCGQGIAGYIRVCARMRSVTDRPLWIKANAGLPKMVDGRAVYETTAEEFAQQAPALVAAGANFVGGCCGTSPVFIQALKGALGAGSTRPR